MRGGTDLLAPVSESSPLYAPAVPGYPNAPNAATSALPRRSSAKPILAVAAVTAGALVVLALLLTGTIPSPLYHKPSSGNAGPDLSYSQARPVGDRTAHAYAGGPWTFEATIAFALYSHWAEWGSNSAGGSCGGPAGTIYYPAEAGSVTTGLAPFWVFLYTDYLGEDLEVGVTNGTASITLTLSVAQSGCGAPNWPAVNGTVIDSPVAATVANDHGGAAFIAQHPQASASYELADISNGLGGGLGGASGAAWVVSYSSCLFGSSGGATSGAFTATVNATTGAFLTATNNSYPCGGGRNPTAVSMTATSAGACANTGAGGLSYNTFAIVIGGTTGTLTTANFALSLTQAGSATGTVPGANVAAATTTCPVGNGGVVPSAAGNWEAVLLAAGSGSVLAVFGGAARSWTTASGAPLGSPVTIAGGQSLVITAGTGVTLVQADVAVYGTNGASVTGSVTI